MMRKYIIWAIPLILIVSGIFQFACGGSGGATTPDATYDAEYPPRNYDWEEGNRILTVSWDPVPFAVGYRVYLSEDGVDFIMYAGTTPISQSQIIITGLQNNQDYYVGASAVGSTMKETLISYPGGAPNAQPLTPNTDIIEIYEGFPPAPPANLQGYAGDLLVELEWDRNTEPDLLELGAYKVYRAREYTYPDAYLGEFSAFPAVTNNAYADQDVLNGVRYHYYVTATDQENLESGKSNVVKYTPMSAPPLMPANFTAKFVAFQGVVLDWKKTYEQDIRAYRIIRYDWTDGTVDPLLDTIVITLQYPEDPIIGAFPPLADEFIESTHIYEYWCAAMDVEKQFGPAAVSQKVQIP